MGTLEPQGTNNVRELLAELLLPNQDIEDPNSELHHFIIARINKFKKPQTKEEWSRLAPKIRRRFLEDVFFKGHSNNTKPTNSREIPACSPKVQWREKIKPSPEYIIHKLMFEGYPGMWIPALLYEPTSMKGRIPGVLNPNGHHLGGKAMVYKQARCINLAKRGMLALSTEFIGMGELTNSLNFVDGAFRHSNTAYFDLYGYSGVSIFYLAMKHGLDVLLSHPNCDPERIAMTGLSGGGWQTAILSALDERIKVIVPVAGYSPLWQRVSSTKDIGDLEQNPPDLCLAGDYDVLTALYAPRPTLLIYNKYDDCCFRSERTKISVYEPAREIFDLLDVSGNLEFYENVDPGTHNYEADNRSQLYRFLNKHFKLSTPEGDLPYQDELLSESQLEVGLPSNSATLLSLAKNLVKNMPRIRVPRGSKREINLWLSKSRQRLREIIHYQNYKYYEQVVKEDSGVSHHVLNLNDVWSIPITEFRQSNGEVQGKEVTVQILLSDTGRRSLSQLSEKYLSKGSKVVAADIFGTGELNFPWNLQMMVSAVGERPLGIIVGQIQSLLKWALDRSCKPKVGLVATGPITSFASLCYAALEPDTLSQLYLAGLIDSLRRLVDFPIAYEKAVPLFCFGFLREFDIPQLIIMTEELQIELQGHGPLRPVINA